MQSLPPADRAYIATLRDEKRRQQSTAARLALLLLHQQMGLSYQGYRWQGQAGPVCLAHSSQLALAVLHTGGAAVGADIELPQARMQQLAPRFLNQEELDLLHPHLLPQAWAAKEALLKCWPLPGRDWRMDLHLGSYHEMQPGHYAIAARLKLGAVMHETTVHCAEMQGHVLAWVEAR